MSTVRLGAFIVGTLAALTGGIFLIGARQLTFRSTYRLKTEFQNVAGLMEGAEVRVGGIHEGTVREIDLPNRPDGKVIVQMDLASKTKAVVKQDSVASIQSEGLIGDKYVEVTFGSEQASAVKHGDTIASQPPFEMSSLFKKTDGILDQVQDAARNINGSSKDLQAITDKINNGNGTVGALINDKSLYQKVNAGATAFQEDAEALKHNFLLRGFFHERGYEDPAELTRNAIQQLPPGPIEKQFSFDAKGLFDKPDTAKLKNEKSLKQAGQFLQDNQFALAVVAALGGMKGDTSKENQLTLARAAVVRDYLVKNFRLDDKRVKTIGMGKNPDTPDNGQVEIVVYSMAAPAAGKK